MKGHVQNTGGLVEITVTDTPERISAFLHALTENKPAPSEIVHMKREITEYREFNDFTIIKSDTGNDDVVMLPADIAVCPHCLKELYDKTNPRYRHPFISCMICGPRYTIMEDIPYDRNTTTMNEFPMCDLCESEYTDIRDRRHHAQTISCHTCGPELLWKGADVDEPRTCDESQTRDAKKFDVSADAASSAVTSQRALHKATDVLKNGGVILFKSTGGYNLVADPQNPKAVAKLRRIKQRREKPFAVMFRNMEQVKELCFVDAVEEKLLESSARPIILLERKGYWQTDFMASLKNDSSHHAVSEFQKSRFIGAFLPSLAAQYLLLDHISPLIFTSANLSDMPMIKDDDVALALFEKDPDIAGVLYNDRKILVRADDSVARVIDGQPQMIRRSKGYVPVPLHIDTRHVNKCSPNDHEQTTPPHYTQQILATGSQLKNSFALTKGSFVYMSQFFGDLDSIENQHIYESELYRLERLLRIKPKAIVCDLHPLYFTTQFSEKYAQLYNIPLLKVQHHHAHVASVMAENHLSGKVIGVSFDGTGYGTDGCIWGGEFLLCEGSTMDRIAHLPYVDMIGGDSSVKNAVHSALSYIHAYQHNSSDEDRADSSLNTSTATVDISDIIQYGYERLAALPDAPVIEKALAGKINIVKSSSMGRLFDAVSSLLGIKDYNDCEGQCAMLLEDAAAFSQKNPGVSAPCDLALSFHHRVSDMILHQCIEAREKYNADQVALTGGTFQNKILMEETLSKLRLHGFKPYYNISVSPNDGGIALGQAYIGMHK